MKGLRTTQLGFAMPAIFLAVAVAFIGSLNVKSDDGTTLASKMGFDQESQTEFAAIESKPMEETAETR